MPPVKKSRAFPTGNALFYILLLSVAFGRVRPGGRTLFLFVNIRFAVKSFHKYPIDTQDSPNAF